MSNQKRLDEHDSPNSTITVSGGVNVNSEGNTDIGGDVVGRDNFKTFITNVMRDNQPVVVVGIVAVVIVALVIFGVVAVLVSQRNTGTIPTDLPVSVPSVDSDVRETTATTTPVSSISPAPVLSQTPAVVPTHGALQVTALPSLQFTTPIPIPTRNSILPSMRSGEIFVRVPTVCKNDLFSLKAGDSVVGGGQTNTRVKVAAGNYDIIFVSDFGNQITRASVAIQEEQETTVDLTADLGAVRLEGYPQLDKPLRFYANADFSSLSWFVGEQYCASLGSQRIMFVNSYYARGPNSSFLITDGLFENTDTSFDIEIKPDEETVIKPELWPQQLGVVTFSPLQEGRIGFKVIDLQSGQEHDHNPFNSPGPYWIATGKYKFIMSNPILGLTFENVEIRAGEETVLQIPE
jgi:hypothetical protein